VVSINLLGTFVLSLKFTSARRDLNEHTIDGRGVEHAVTEDATEEEEGDDRIASSRRPTGEDVYLEGAFAPALSDRNGGLEDWYDESRIALKATWGAVRVLWQGHDQPQ
jgi:hypothetical protein